MNFTCCRIETNWVRLNCKKVRNIQLALLLNQLLHMKFWISKVTDYIRKHILANFTKQILMLWKVKKYLAIEYWNNDKNYVHFYTIQIAIQYRLLYDTVSISLLQNRDIYYLRMLCTKYKTSKYIYIHCNYTKTTTVISTIVLVWYTPSFYIFMRPLADRCVRLCLELPCNTLSAMPAMWSADEGRDRDGSKSDEPVCECDKESSEKSILPALRLQAPHPDDDKELPLPYCGLCDNGVDGTTSSSALCLWPPLTALPDWAVAEAT